MRRLLLPSVLAGALSVAPRLTYAQAAPGVVPSASLVSRNDSLKQLQSLDAAIQRADAGSDTWHYRGMLAWGLSDAEGRTGFMERTANDSLLDVAEESLKQAVREENAGYLVDLGRFYLTSNSAKVRSRAKGLFEKALDAARKSGDSVAMARAQDELGMTWWRRYVDRANRHIYSYILDNVKDRTFTKDPRSIAYFIDNQTIRAAAQDWSGQREYLRAWDHFSDALAADPANAGALRHTYMALADRQRWVELEHVARMRLDADSVDAWAWLASGLAEHRLGNDLAADTAFNRGLAALPARERERYDRLGRIFTPRDSAGAARLPDSERENLRQMYWLMADPLWSTEDNEHRLEFLSRVVFAELRFSVEEFDVHGADTERGEVYVRYGPPPAVISFPPDPVRHEESRIQVLWWYSADESFLFRELPTYGVATLAPPDLRELRRLRDTVPVVWRNAGDDHYVDSIPVQLVRFRASADSGDVFVAARVPVRRLINGIDLARGALDLDFRAYSWRAEPVFHDSTRQVLDFRNTASGELRSWSTRVPTGTFLYRVEALQPDAGRGARGASRIEVNPYRGFGISDLLVAAKITQRPGSTSGRWFDYDIDPNLGVVKSGQPFSLLWETYGLTPRDGSDEYDVNIKVERVRRGGIGALAAKIVGGVAGLVGISHGGNDEVTLSFPRRIPATNVALDHVTLDLGDASPGRYDLEVTITDRATGTRVVEKSSIAVVE
ncbi:MAG TPA: GWxTD domain-containing protein [Gemmatimonadaceae bacterium]|nr:GWxTD domain-containing protein [Gemmatimonadaceae bacterium]